MVWEPFALAVVFGLVVSAGLYFIVMWPQIEPDDEGDADDDAGEAGEATVEPVAAAPAITDGPELGAEPAADASPADGATTPGTED